MAQVALSYSAAQIDAAIAKINSLIFDNTPKLASNNPVTSNGIREALDVQKLEVDAAKEEALQAIDNTEQSAIINFNAQRVTPEMLSAEVLQLINASGGGTITNLPDGEDLTTENVNQSGGVLKFANRQFDSVNFSGKGYCILRKNIQENKNVLEQSYISKTNTIYVIRYDYDLNGSKINIPENSILLFDGGSLRNGTIIIGNSNIIAGFYKIFDNILIYDKGVDSAKIIFKVEWFGAIGDGITDDTLAIQSCSNNSRYGIEFQTKNYVISDTISIKCRNVITNNAVFITTVKRKFAFVFDSTASNTTGYSTIRGAFTLENRDKDFEIIFDTVSFPALSVNLTTIEAIDTSKVAYKDFTIAGAEVGDMVIIENEPIQGGYIKFSGEVIAKNTVRIYANNFSYSNVNIEQTELNVKILSGVCHGINIGGTIQSFECIRLIQYTGVSCGIGSGVDIECGIRYQALSKCYYSHLEVNTFAAGGITFSCNARNNCNTFKVISFSAPYSTSHELANTYPIHSVVIGGINNFFEVLSLEGLYEKEAMVLYGIGNVCNNAYCELVQNELYPSNNKCIKSYRYSAGNSIVFRYANAFIDFINDVKGVNFIEKTQAYYINGGMQRRPNISRNLLSNFSFKYGFANWNDFTSGNNKSKEIIPGAFNNTFGYKFYTENGRIALSQDITLPTDSINNVILTASCWVRKSECNIAISTTGVQVMNNTSKKYDEWNYIETKVMMPFENKSVSKITVQFRSPDNYTGELEIFNPCLTIGENAESFGNDIQSVYKIGQGIVFNSGSAINAGETYYYDYENSNVNENSIINFSFSTTDKNAFLEKFDIIAYPINGFIRLKLTNKTQSVQYSTRIYPTFHIL